MGFLLQWKNYSVRSKERILADLYSYLSHKWYSVRIVGSNIYNFFDMYADQLSSMSVEVQQTFDDLSLLTVRNTPIYNRSTSKLYDNFGSIFEVNKLWNQNNDTYSSSSLLSSYRQQLRFLSEAYLVGSTINALQKTGEGYTGASPIILQPYVDHIGWRLISFSASVIAEGKNVQVLDTYYPGIGDIIYTNLSSGSTGHILKYSHSRLGYNTRPVSRQHFYSGLKIFIYGSTSVNNSIAPYLTRTTGSMNGSFDLSIENTIKNLVRADIDPLFFYSNNYVYDKYNLGDTILGDSNFTFSSGGFVYNRTSYGSNLNYIVVPATSPYSGNIFSGEINKPTGSLLRSRIVTLPLNYANYVWFYDWSTLLRNDAYYNAQVRSYPSASIPNTVYYKDVKFVTPKTLLLQMPSGATGAHWLFQDKNYAQDITGNGNNLAISTASVNNISLMRPRQGLRLGIYGEKGSYLYRYITSDKLNFYSADFFLEAWITGIDKSAVGNFTSFTVKRQSTINDTYNLTSKGYALIITSASQSVALQIRDDSGEIYTLNGSIADLFTEEPERPHYFAASYNNGKCFVYLDGRQIATGSSTVIPSDVIKVIQLLNVKVLI